jgi:polyhydroxybutyrate depolymerase
MLRRKCLLPALTVLAFGCASGATDLTVASADRIEIEVGGRSRSFLLHVPASVKESVPLLLAFHGGGGNAAGYQKSAGINRVANREGFAVAYPDGTGRRPGSRRFLTWNAGDCCGRAQQEASDDVAFAVAVIEATAERIRINRDRVYATGHSNGAMMSYRVAAEAAEQFAAVAPVAGSMNVSNFAPTVPVAILHIHSVDDPRAHYQGGQTKTGRNTIQHYDVETRLDQWRVHNKCNADREKLDERTRGGHTATLFAWRHCTSGREVALWKLTGAGHGWPGGRSQLPERIVGPQTEVIDAAEEAWRFLSRFRRMPQAAR